MFEQNLSSMGSVFLARAKAHLETYCEPDEAPDWTNLDCMTVAIVYDEIFYKVVIYEGEKNWTVGELEF